MMNQSATCLLRDTPSLSRFASLLFAAALLVGCGSSKDPFAADARFAKDMCACTTLDCALSLKKQRKAHQAKTSKKLEERLKAGEFSADQLKKLGKSGQEFYKCHQAIMKKHGDKHPEVVRRRGLADKICACKDSKCVAPLWKEYMKTGRGTTSAVSAHLKPIYKRAQACFKTAMEAGNK